jgi:hypothetical protein
MPDCGGENRDEQRTPVSYWLCGAALLVYVAACTGHRDNVWGADAWEHHRVILALSQDFEHPQNPTYAAEPPSIRYSPYSVVLAAISRASGIDTWDVLSAAGVVNVLGLLVALWFFLAAYREQRIATYALLMMLGLWLVAPGYASSNALSDMPWHGVNPTAFALPIILIVWAIARRISCGTLSPLWGLAIGPLSSSVILTHAIAGAFCALGLAILLLLCPSEYRGRLFIVLIASAIFGAALCFLWPWYDFTKVLVGKKLEGTWFNLAIAWRTLTVWYLPSILFALFALPMRSRPLVAFCLLGLVASYAMGWLSIPLRSFSLQRGSLAGVWFAQIAVAAWAADSKLLDPRTWNGRIRNLLSEDILTSCRPAVDVCLMILLLWGFGTQIWSIAREAHLARAYVAPLTGREYKQLDLRRRYAGLLAPMKLHDVVLADNRTAWPVPSFGGRIVSSLHGEFFIMDEAEREKDVQLFFAEGTDDKQRAKIVRRYKARWIMLNTEVLSEKTLQQLLESSAVVGRDETLILMDAEKWMAARESKDPAAANRAAQTNSGYDALGIAMRIAG